MIETEANNERKYVLISKNGYTKSITLKDEILYALKNRKSNNKIILSIVNAENARKIERLTGLKVEGRNQVLYDNDIRHILLTHQNEKKEIMKHQIPVLNDDIANIPNIINNPDNIILGTLNREGQTIRYIKRYDEYDTYVVEVIPKKSDLKIKTMWKVSTLANSNNS